MKITFLGTSAATACPLPFCNCRTCQSARQLGGKDFRKRSSLLVNHDLIIDMGPDLMSAAFMHGVDTAQIRYWLQTHAHSDHFDAAHLITRIADYAAVDVKPLSLYASSPCIAHMSAKLGREEAGANLMEAQWIDRLSMSVNMVENGRPCSCGPYTVTALTSNHDENDGSMVYLVSDGCSTLFYCLDTDSLPGDTLDYLFENKVYLDVIVLDHTYGYGINGSGHLNANKVISILTTLERKSVIDQDTRALASHISHEGNPPHNALVLFARQHGYDVAYDGLVMTVQPIRNP